MANKGLDLAVMAWPASRLGELLESLARRAKLISRPIKLPQPPDSLWMRGGQGDDDTIGRWLGAAANTLEIEVEPVDTLYAEVEMLIRAGGPAILRMPGPLDADQPRLIALLSGGSKNARILTPDLKVRRVGVDKIRAAICYPYEAVIGPEIDQILADAEVPPERFARSRKTILYEQLGPLRIEGGWLVRLPPGASLWNQFRHGGVYTRVFIMLTMYFFQQFLAIASWFMIGRGIFQGHIDWAWLMAWVILLFATIPVAVIVGDAQSELSMSVGAVFKQRLLFGTLKLEPEEIRHQGMGQFLGRVMESEAVEMLALSGGYMALLAFVELLLAAYILSLGAGGTVQVVTLGIWVLITLVMLWRYARMSRDWAAAYREMTNDLVERMVGHRTRLAQEDPGHWHDDEDQALDAYLKLSENMDRIGMQINAVVSRGWIVVGLAGLAFPFITNTAAPAALAIGLGGVLYASQALAKLAGGTQSLSALVNAWQQVGPLFDASTRVTDTPSLDFVTVQRNAKIPQAKDGPPQLNLNGEEEQALLVARDIVFRYRPHGRPVIEECSLQVKAGERLLLEGPSGGGKSTLAALLTGLRNPESGSLLLWGFDRQILGTQEWRRRVVMAPQFQENHVFSETFAFNLLMGRRWPPLQEDLEEAEAICRELGLGEVLDRMPSGFQQMLGESGWQLSHGERSRLFIARTLLQQADLVVLDESFGALDPENLNRALRCVLDRAPTVMVIAHP